MISEQSVIYPPDFATAETSREVTVQIIVDEYGKINRSYHGDPFISAKRKDTLKWQCIVHPLLKPEDVVFEVSNFHKICNLPGNFCSHPESPFMEMKGKRANCRETITSDEPKPEAGGGRYKSTWTVYVRGEITDVWDPHIFVHDGI